ncbi:MAG: glycosyl hydrolase family 8, partial [Phycisphaerae bacterium]
SPWYWWADVPTVHNDSVYIKAGRYVQGPPMVKYRGIFINDEWPAMGRWTTAKFGGFNSKLYTKVFELLLRLKGNYLWPAMWNSAFNEDDPNNAKLADEYGIVMGTSHQEPMLRAQKEWDRRHNRKWNYYTDADTLRKFWREGISRNKDYESIITIGLRGADDTPMLPNGTVEESMKFLEGIIDYQRKIIAEEINPDVTKVPQMWCPYKETQEYYERGLHIPEDITILWCDDNWGNIRRLPTEKERKRQGGAGVYYHFDFHGGPRSYEWLNTTPLTKIWEQMNLAWNYGATEIWIVNVGDLKPMEFPMEFFITYGWDPQRWTREKVSDYTRLWAKREFGEKHAAEIAEMMTLYTKYTARRKPELLDPTIYSLIHYREADRVSAEYKELTARAEKIYNSLPENYKDAFFQLLLYPIKATAQVTDLYIAVAKNRLYARQRRASANDYAAQAHALFKSDADLTNYYNTVMADGKWNHMMDAVRIGFTSWNPPPQNNMPQVVDVNVPDEAEMAVAIEGSFNTWLSSSDDAVLPELNVFSQQNTFIDVFNRGKTPFEFSAKTSESWITLSSTSGEIEKEQCLWVGIDWEKAPQGKNQGDIIISGANEKQVTVKVPIFNPTEPTRDCLKGFVEENGYVSIEAENYTKKIDAPKVSWEKIEDYGRTLSAMSIFPVTADSVTPPKDAPCLEYKMYIFNPGQVEVHGIFASTLNFVPDRDLRYAVSFNDEQPQIITLVDKDYVVDYSNNDWQDSVRNNVRVRKSTHTLDKAGYHTLKIWMVDPGVVLEKIMVDTGGLKPSYLGPPQSYRGTGKTADKTISEEGQKKSMGAFKTGQYRNLFVEAGYSSDEVAAKIENSFKQLFYGDSDTQRLYYPAGSNKNGPLAYILDVHNDDVRSEGMSYGMMIAVQLDKKAEFDAIWNWAKTYMYNDKPDHPGRGYFCWSVDIDGKVNDDLPAPDGEEYFAMSLYFAAGRWGNGEGIYNYQKWADKILDDMKNREPITGLSTRGIRTTLSLFDAESKMVRFSPVDTISNFTDPSYHLPAFYELWALWGPKADRAFWAKAAEVSRKFFHCVTNPDTALSPEYADFECKPWAAVEWNPNSIHFQYDAWRTVMNWSMDWAWWAKDSGQQRLSDTLQAFFESEGMHTYADQYTLEGVRLTTDHSTGLVAMNAVGSLAATHPRAKNFVRALWNEPIPTGEYRYYNGMLYMLGMLHCSGDFRIWPVQAS